MSRNKSLLCIVIISMALAVFIGCTKYTKDQQGDEVDNINTNRTDTYSDTWAATDELGRKMPGFEEVGPLRQDKYVGIFYHLWHHNVFYLAEKSWDTKAPDVTRILTENPLALDNSKRPPWGASTPYYWGKPLFGYYDLQYDDYVLKKHAQMLSDAGVDTLIFDFTNCAKDSPSFYDWESLMHLCKVFKEVRDAGGSTPQFTFLLRWNGSGGEYAIRKLYNDLYSKGLYSDLWFKWEGKPLLIGDKDSLDSLDDKDAIDFFTWRSAHPLYTPPTVPNTWSWNSINPNGTSYTKTNPKEEVAVGVAQNWTTGLAFFSSRDEDGNFIARGRSFQNGVQPLSKDPLSSEYPSKYGYNFQEGLDNALEIDPNFIFVTAWNEWIMGRFDAKKVPDWAIQHAQPACGAFCDSFTPEFSRDIEPTLDGGLGDNYYYQLASAIRKFKGVRKPEEASASKTISIDGDFSDWLDVKPEFRDDIGDKAIRNAKSLAKGVTYTNDTGRNDFSLMKIARDKENIYFYVETVDDITSYTDPNWMRLFIKIDDTIPSWQGYNYIVNRIGVSEAVTTLEKSTGDWNWEAVNSNIKYKIDKNKMELIIPRSDLGLNGFNKPIDIQFKWNDNMQVDGDIYEFILNGDTAPNNRFNYCYTAMPITKDMIWIFIFIMLILHRLIIIFKKSILIILQMFRKKIKNIFKK